jgi:crotonobetainyl-CoA:carnitine CoA-transferase CaiB-like acyl-CoA transferase
MAGPLSGLRVVDFGQYIAAPLTAMLLADHGAEVIRVDPPTGPRWDTPANATWNRGKRSIALDLTTEADRTLAQTLVASADVVIEGFRPGVMDRLGLGPSALLAAHPRLICCSIPGFASDDPRAELAAWEGVIAAATATYRPAPGAADDRPLYTAIQISSHFAAFQSALAIVMALIARERTGLGQRIEVPLFDATFAAIGAHGLLIDGKPAGGRPDDFWGGLFECQDGRWVFFSGSTPRFRQRFVEATGLQRWQTEGLLDIPRLTRDTALSTRLRERLRALFKSRPAHDWEALGGASGVPITVARTSAEWITTPHAREAGIVRSVDDPRLGTVWQPGRAVRLSASPDEPLAPAPVLDADRASILASLSSTTRSAHTGAVLASPGLPASGVRGNGAGDEGKRALDGLRVVDLSLVLAGPTAGRTLAEYGASVVKINNPREEGAGYRTSVHRYHTDVNRAKATVLVDLKTAAGKDILFRLVQRADVVVQNFRLGVPERLGIGYEVLRKLKPDLVYVSVSAFGYAGPWGTWPGYEPNAQATTGLQARMGGDGAPLMQPFAVNDYGTGLLAAYGAALALYHRARTGAGQRVEAALAFTGTLLQSAYLQEYAGKVWDEPRGREARGSGPLQRLYRVSDGWIFVGAREDQRAALATVDGLAGGDALAGDALAAFLAERFATRPAAAWASDLTAIGIGAQPVVTSLSRLMTDPWVTAHGLSVTRQHDTGQQITTIGPGARLSLTPVTPGRPVATPGADAREVLAQIDLADALPRLCADGTVLIEPPAVPVRAEQP